MSQRQGGGVGLLPASAAPEILRVDEVSVSLSGRQVLDRVGFGIGTGQFTGLIGPNGAGKTTLLRVILGLARPTTGTVTVAGGPRATGYVPQKVMLDPDIPMRARDLVALGLDGHRLGMPLRPGKRAQAVREMLHAVDADHFADARVGELSGGEQQRVLIAHALISRPQLLLLDEPLANLDIRASQEIVGLLARLTREQQIAVLLSAHDVNPLLPVMDNVIYLAAGRAASGPASEVIRGEVLSQLYGYHVDVLHVHGRVLVAAGPASPETAGPSPAPGTG
jgi:zinc/manganese transport system ATP-binding protein